ncbi:MAG: hypothetical protein BSOLF_0362 [Candidatus Carbobacillus altaicus]|uniref:Uncharacterized protein n=1 Tax=Candidatus Carbonibacillus altaicus TaxID=2163959 RepID=A0A2R6Y0X4_9BACL|nr:MAG: hypothetical protein BSOLF_1733 [Candidatus Carbobacillus altaicus]PTQ56327.1 MAG: hypothetical protein BSOLF_0362 [Candidatus Carbobacillus altaicus]
MTHLHPVITVKQHAVHSPEMRPVEILVPESFAGQLASSASFVFNR